MTDTPTIERTEDRRPARGPRQTVVAALATWAAFVARWRWLVIILALVSTTLLAGYTARNLGINTDTTGLISEDLAFRKNYEAFRKAFPFFNGTIAIVVDGRTADAAQDGAAALYKRLANDGTHFSTVFYLQGEKFFRDNGLLYLSVDDLTKISTRMAQAQPLLAELARDPSLRGLFGLFSQAVDSLGTKDAQPGQLADVLDRFSAVIAARAQGKSDTLSWSTLLAASVDPENDRRRIIVVQPKLDFKSLSPAKAAMDKIRSTARDLGLTPANGVTIRLTGGAAISSEELQSVAIGASVAGYLSLAAVALLLMVGLRSIWLVLSVLLTLVIGLIWTAAFATVAVGSLNLLSVAFAVLFIGLGVDFGIHFALRYKEEVDQESKGVPGIANATRAVGGAMTLSAVAAAAAFLSFLPTDYRGVSELGLIAGAGMAIALFCSLTILPALLTASPIRRARHYRDRRATRVTREVRVEQFIYRHRRGLVAIGAVLGIAALAAAPFVRFDRNPLNLKDPGTESVQTAVDLMGDSRFGTGGLSAMTASRADATALADKLRKLSTVKSVRTIDSFIPRDQAEKLDIIEEMALFLTPVLNVTDGKPPPTAAERLAAVEKLKGSIGKALTEKRAGALAEKLTRLQAALDAFLATKPTPDALEKLGKALTGGFPPRLRALKDALSAKPITFENLPKSLVEREVSADGRYRVYILPKADLRDNDSLRAFVTQVLSVAPTATGGPVVELLSGDAVVGAFVESSLIAFAVIALMLLILLRSLRAMLMILVTVILAGAFTLAIVVAAGLSFNFANIIVVPLLLGLGVASAIHLVVRARREAGVILLNTSTPRAILFSALTTLASFGSLAVTNHQGTASMGIVLVIALSMTLLCSLIFLPALIDLFGKAPAPASPDEKGQAEGPAS